MFILKRLFVALVITLIHTDLSFAATDSGLTVIAISIPKSGTHLLQKCLSLLVRETSYKIYDEDMSLKKPNTLNCTNQKFRSENSHITRCTFIPPRIAAYLASPSPSEKILIHTTKQSCMWHLPAFEENIALMNNPFIRLFLIIRDPRDQVVSFAHMMKKNSSRWPEAKTISLEDIISNLITSGSLHYPFYYRYQSNITEFYNLFLPWIKLNNICLIRFENLVGPLGGGDAELQLNEIKKIASHMGLEIDRNKQQEIALQLFGGTGTFREGKIGSWQNTLTKFHKLVFAQTNGALDLVKNLGYSNDNSWAYE